MRFFYFFIDYCLKKIHKKKVSGVIALLCFFFFYVCFAKNSY